MVRPLNVGAPAVGLLSRAWRCARCTGGQEGREARGQGASLSKGAACVQALSCLQRTPIQQQTCPGSPTALHSAVALAAVLGGARAHHLDAPTLHLRLCSGGLRAARPAGQVCCWKRAKRRLLLVARCIAAHQAEALAALGVGLEDGQAPPLCQAEALVAARCKQGRQPEARSALAACSHRRVHHGTAKHSKHQPFRHTGRATRQPQALTRPGSGAGPCRGSTARSAGACAGSGPGASAWGGSACSGRACRPGSPWSTPAAVVGGWRGDMQAMECGRRRNHALPALSAASQPAQPYHT